MLAWLARCELKQLLLLARVLLARGLPGFEIALLLPDHEAAQAGLEVDEERLQPVRRRDHLLGATRLERPVAQPHDRDQEQREDDRQAGCEAAHAERDPGHEPRPCPRSALSVRSVRARFARCNG